MSVTERADDDGKLAVAAAAADVVFGAAEVIDRSGSGFLPVRPSVCPSVCRMRVDTNRRRRERAFLLSNASKQRLYRADLRLRDRSLSTRLRNATHFLELSRKSLAQPLNEKSRQCAYMPKEGRRSTLCRNCLCLQFG